MRWTDGWGKSGEKPTSAHRHRICHQPPVVRILWLCLCSPYLSLQGKMGSLWSRCLLSTSYLHCLKGERFKEAEARFFSPRSVEQGQTFLFLRGIDPEILKLCAYLLCPHWPGPWCLLPRFWTSNQQFHSHPGSVLVSPHITPCWKTTYHTYHRCILLFSNLPVHPPTPPPAEKRHRITNSSSHPPPANHSTWFPTYHLQAVLHRTTSKVVLCTRKINSKHHNFWINYNDQPVSLQPSPDSLLQPSFHSLCYPACYKNQKDNSLLCCLEFVVW